MNRYFYHIITFCIVSLIFLGVLGTRTLIFAQVNENDIDEKMERQEELQNEKSQYQEELKEVKKKKKEVYQDLMDTDRDLDWTQKKLRNKEKELSRKRAQKEIITNQLSIASNDLEATQTLFEDRLRIYYKSIAQNPFNLILDAKDLSDLIVRIRYTEGLLSYDEQTIETITDQKSLLAQMKEDLTREVRAEENLWREIEDDREKYQRLHNKKRATLREITSDEKELVKLLADIEKEETEIAFFLEAAAKGNLQTNFDGSFSRPLSSYQVSSRFGMRIHPIFKRRKMHNGIDLAAGKGTPILAAGAGRVIFAGWKKGYGNTVMIDHGRGYATLYGHMSMILVDVGKDVMEGQPIGKVGSTGISTNNHLHFEIRVNGKPKNPTSFLSF